jgi:hypothetical protein
VRCNSRQQLLGDSTPARHCAIMSAALRNDISLLMLVQIACISGVAA